MRTQTQDDTNNPIYYEVKEIELEYETIETAQPIVLRIFDTDDDLFDSTDDFMGQAVIFLTEVENLSTSDEIPYPQWYPVKRMLDDVYDENHGAAILCSF